MQPIRLGLDTEVRDRRSEDAEWWSENARGMRGGGEVGRRGLQPGNDQYYSYTPSSRGSTKDEWKSTRNWTFSICKNDNKALSQRGTSKMIPRRLPARYSRIAIFSDSLGRISVLSFFLFFTIIAQIPFRKIYKHICAYHTIIDGI